jgi:hypothetical protein
LVTLLRALLDNDQRTARGGGDVGRAGEEEREDATLSELRHMTELRQRRAKERNMRRLGEKAHKLKDIEKSLNEILI